MKRGILLGVLLMMALDRARRWWEPHGSMPLEMKGRSHW